MANELGFGSGSGFPTSLDVDATQESATTAVRFEVPNDLADAIINAQTEMGVRGSATLSLRPTINVEHNEADGTHKVSLVMMLAGTQTVTGAKTFSANLTVAKSTAKVIINGTGSTDAHVDFQDAGTDKARIVYDQSSGNFQIDDGTTARWRMVAATGAITSINDYSGNNIFSGANTLSGTNNFTGITSFNAAPIMNTAAGTPAINSMYKENVPKGWIQFNASGTDLNSFNVSSVTDTGTGDWTVVWDTDLASANCSITSTCEVGSAYICNIISPATSGCQVTCRNSGGALADPTTMCVTVMGDQ